MAKKFSDDFGETITVSIFIGYGLTVLLLFVWWIPSIFWSIISEGESSIAFLVYSFRGFIITGIIVSILLIIPAEKALKERKREQEKERKKLKRKQEKKTKKFAESQKAKGLVLYDKKWMTKNEKSTEERLDSFVAKMKAIDKFKGAFMKCNHCGYIWKVKKDFGLPARCGKCSSEHIKIDKRKSYYN
jgi:hypothetical protein